MKNSYIKLNDTFHRAYDWYKWPEVDEGVGVADFLAEGKGEIRLELHGNIYERKKSEIRREAKKFNAYYQANSMKLLVTQLKNWNLLGNKVELEERRKEEQLRYAVQ